MYTLKKTSTLTMALAVVIALLFGVLSMFGGKPASAADPTDPGAASGDGVKPALYQANPTCSILGQGYRELKIDNVNGPFNGTYTSNDGALTVTISNSTSQTFDWNSNIGVDAVIVKGGTAGDAYVYDPPKEDTADTGLHPPVNPNNGQYFGVSHVSFCYDLELNVSKTANTSLTRTYKWTIDKSVTPKTWDLFKGDSGTSDYSVAVTKDSGTDSNWKVTGTITVTSPIDNAKVTGLTDVVSQGATNTNGTILNCTKDGNAVADPSGVNPVTLNTGDKLECTYRALLGSGDNGTNTATATTNTTDLKGGTGTANVDFSTAQINKVNDQVTVKDVFDGQTTTLGTTAESKTFPYTRTFKCNTDKGTHENTATLYGDKDAVLGSDKASVTVNCYELAVSKNAQTSLEKKWTWTVDKSADKSDITLSIGQSLDVNYDVVYRASSAESKFAASGTITVKNNAPIDAEINSVSDVISGVDQGNVKVDCGSATFPYKLAAGETLTCTYTAELDNKDSRTNTATATLQNYDYDSEKNGTKADTTNFSGTAPVSFSNATVTEIDEEIAVSDTFAGSNVTGTVKAADAPKTFEYIRKVGPYEQCGDQPSIDNTAKFVTSDTKTEGQDSVSIPVHVPCNGCTLTIGYWKTHADPNSPRNNPDETLKVLESVGGTIWLGTPNGAKSVAVTSSNVVSILKFDGSNGIKKLQAQLLAAKLNEANGAAVPTGVQDTIKAADLFLAANGASSWDSLTRTQKNQVLTWMNKLDQYNNGLIGPGHCSEESTI
jgi:hypothetical protein